MKLWLISQEHNVGYDIHDSAVVVAGDEDAAKRVNPNGGVNPEEHGPFSTWAAPQFVTARYIGDTEEAEGSVICASFNAG